MSARPHISGENELGASKYITECVQFFSSTTHKIKRNKNYLALWYELRSWFFWYKLDQKESDKRSIQMLETEFENEVKLVNYVQVSFDLKRV